MFAKKVSSLIKNWVALRFYNFIVKVLYFAIYNIAFQFEFNLLELLSQGESDSLIKT